MNDTQIIPVSKERAVTLLVPRADVRVRVATMDDVPFMDGLQKQHSRQLGYFPTKQFEGYVEMGGILIAEDEGGTPLGYVISRDRYLKRDELGVVYQLCVVPGVRRGLVGATLLKAVFDRSAYGCRLYCCWCAQDLEANRFWESMGFVPLAFRAGSANKKGLAGAGRVHIFWQKRITEGDDTTPWWYPFQTTAGAIRQDRLVFPIPPGTHWSQVQAVAVPTVGSDDATEVRRRERKAAPAAPPDPATVKVPIYLGGKVRYVQRPANVSPFTAPPSAPAAEPARAETMAIVVKSKSAPVAKIDPAFIAANRELRDRYLEHLNADPSVLPALGKYNAVRALPGPTVVERRAIAPAPARALPEAA